MNLSLGHRLYWLLAWAALAACGSLAEAAPGALDPTFGNFGVATLPPVTGGSALGVQPDGMVVIAGASLDGAVLVRLDAKGALDPGFGAGGIAAVPLGTGDAQATALAVQPDGRILVVGSTYTEYHEHGLVFLARFNRDGTIDPSFGRSGTTVFSVIPPTPPAGDVHYPDYVDYVGLALQSDGRAVVAGGAHSSAGATTVFLLRFDANGSLERDFAPGLQGLAPLARSYIRSVSFGPLVQADGRILLFGENLPSGGTGVQPFAAVRFGPDGSIDASFGNEGVISLPFMPTHALQEKGGRILVAGAQGGPPILQVVRVNADGSPDRTFGTDGVAAAAFGECRPSTSAHIDPCPRGRTQIALQPDGKIVQTGRAYVAGTGEVAAIARYGREGVLDAGFGAGGRATGAARTGGPTNAIDAEGTRLYVGGLAFICCADTVARYLLAVTPATITVASDANPATEGAIVTLSATVNGTFPSGQVAFLDAGNAIAGCEDVALTAAGPTLASAACARVLPPGFHSISVAYLGSATSSPGTSAPLILAVGASAGTGVVEYFNPVLGDYFMTSNADEMAKLDADAATGWQPTGHSFRVFPSGMAHTTMMCRYFTDRAYAPASSHFFGASGGDCALGYPWLFEGNVLPVMPVEPAGGCLDGTAPLFRLYNGSRGGVPHHRYTRDAGVRDAMISQGWIPEGTGIGVVACVPR
ncbi:MAG: Ig-like domain repeat protein [Burkholderiales bacterium]